MLVRGHMYMYTADCKLNLDLFINAILRYSFFNYILPFDYLGYIEKKKRKKNYLQLGLGPQIFESIFY